MPNVPNFQDLSRQQRAATDRFSIKNVIGQISGQSVVPPPGPSPTPTPSITPTVTPTVTVTPTNTCTPTITPTSSVAPTPTPTLTPNFTPSMTKTPTPTPSITPTLTPTPTQTPAPVNTIPYVSNNWLMVNNISQGLSSNYGNVTKNVIPDVLPACLTTVWSNLTSNSNGKWYLMRKYNSISPEIVSSPDTLLIWNSVASQWQLRYVTKDSNEVSQPACPPPRGYVSSSILLDVSTASAQSQNYIPTTGWSNTTIDMLLVTIELYGDGGNCGDCCGGWRVHIDPTYQGRYGSFYLETSYDRGASVGLTTDVSGYLLGSYDILPPDNRMDNDGLLVRLREETVDPYGDNITIYTVWSNFIDFNYYAICN